MSERKNMSEQTHTQNPETDPKAGGLPEGADRKDGSDQVSPDSDTHQAGNVAQPSLSESKDKERPASDQPSSEPSALQGEQY